MMMITTGLRVGGVVKLLINHVANLKNGVYEIKKDGKTKEKGNKFAFFAICPQLQKLLLGWLTTHRPADSGPYVFPGMEQGTHLSTETIRGRFARLSKSCGLEGREFHPHALRHTNAHLLLECGNSFEAVSKCLNHASTGVTQKFYLRESAVEVQNRCKIPWNTELDTRPKDLPTFLDPSAHSATKSSKSESARLESKRRRTANKELLANVSQNLHSAVFTGASASSLPGPVVGHT
jgi:integrase